MNLLISYFIIVSYLPSNFITLKQLHHKLCSKFIWKILFHGYDAYISKMKYFQQPFENISSHLFVHYMCFKCTISMCKKHELMKKIFLHDFHYQIVGCEVCDVWWTQWLHHNYQNIILFQNIIILNVSCHIVVN